MISKPDEYPIQNLIKGNPIGYNASLSQRDVASFWTAPEQPELLVKRLHHTAAHWRRKDHDKLSFKVYHCCDNGSGIHWDANMCGWTCHGGGGKDLELLIDFDATTSGYRTQAI